MSAEIRTVKITSRYTEAVRIEPDTPKRHTWDDDAATVERMKVPQPTQAMIDDAAPLVDVMRRAAQEALSNKDGNP